MDQGRFSREGPPEQEIDRLVMEMRNVLCRAMLAMEDLLDTCGDCTRQNAGERITRVFGNLKEVSRFLQLMDTGPWAKHQDRPWTQTTLPTRRKPDGSDTGS